MLTAADLVTTVEWECPEGFRTHLGSRPAYDGRKGYDQDYGISDVNLWWTLVNPQGAVTWRMDTGWHLPHNTLELERRGYTQWSPDIGQRHPFGYGVAWHHWVREGDPCEFSPTGHCQGTLGRILEDRGVPILLVNGIEGVWRWLLELHQGTDWREAPARP